MTDQYKMFNHKTCKAMTDATSLRELDYGITPLTSHNGKKAIGFGQAAAPANLLVQQVDKKVRQTIDTYGQAGSASSKSAALQLSLENKLQMQFPKGGLTMFIKGWKRKTTPLGRLYCQLAVSVRPISGIDCGLWHTPRTVMIEETPENFRARMNSKRPNDRKDGLPNLAVQALWATPNTMDNMQPRSTEAMKKLMTGARKNRTAPSNLREQVQPDLYPAKLWPTVRSNEVQAITPNMAKRNKSNMEEEVAKALWCSPSARDWKDTPGMKKEAINKDGTKRNRMDQLGRQVFGSTAQTKNKGLLNPAFAFWLMGIPNAWVYSIVRGMQSYRK